MAGGTFKVLPLTAGQFNWINYYRARYHLDNHRPGALGRSRFEKPARGGKQELDVAVLRRARALAAEAVLEVVRGELAVDRGEAQQTGSARGIRWCGVA